MKSSHGREKFILALDEGTTSARAIVFDHGANIRSISQFEFEQLYPKPGWVEHDPSEIWDAQVRAWKQSLKMVKIEPRDICALGVTNQRETTILWDKETGKPVYNAIVWQCRRTADIADWLRREYLSLIKKKTGLIPDSYFSGPKIKWILDNVDGVRKKAEKGEMLFGTIDTYLIWKLTGGRVHVTDFTNASRTMLFDIRNLEWDNEILDILGIPSEILPEPKPSSGIYGYTDPSVFGAEIPIAGDAGDQEAALFGQTCFEKGETKSTYGTGNFVLMNTEDELCYSENLLTTVAWGLNKRKISYALEGSVFITGAAIQWLKDGLDLIKESSEAELLASSLPSNEGVYFVPAFVGLGAPYWDQYARGLVIGITRGTRREHLARAVLEAIAYLTRDVAEGMEKDSGIKIEKLKVDGGAAKNDFLMQFQADVLGIKIKRPVILETTALGTAFLAGLAVDYWESLEEIKGLWKLDKEFDPAMSYERKEGLYKAWKEAVKKALGWAKVIQE